MEVTHSAARTEGEFGSITSASASSNSSAIRSSSSSSLGEGEGDSRIGETSAVTGEGRRDGPALDSTQREVGSISSSGGVTDMMEREMEKSAQAIRLNVIVQRGCAKSATTERQRRNLSTHLVTDITSASPMTKLVVK